MIGKRKVSAGDYPREFWLLFWGVFINRVTESMVWPFLTVYMYQTLGLPLATITLLFPLRAVSSIITTTIVSPIMDKTGRKQIIIWGLLGSGAVFFGMTLINSLMAWAILIIAFGAVLPIYNIGVNTMVADMIPRERRTPAYALIRTVGNAGIAIGPIIGGVLAVISFELVFNLTALSYIVLAVLTVFFISETMPAHPIDSTHLLADGYRFIVKDKRLMSFIGIYFLLLMAYAHMFSLLPVYVSENFGLAENQYSLMITVNALMVVFLQYAVTRYTDRFDDFRVMTVGSLFYTVGLFSFIFGTQLWHFMLSVAIVTMGELIVMPTATTLVANLAPDHMRARYLGLLSLGYPIGSGIGPVIGGFLNDAVAPVAMWYGAGMMALVGVLGFFILSRIWREKIQLMPA
ncbi:MAG: MDR family MFS transporter [Anaerolineae bacterium]